MMRAYVLAVVAGLLLAGPVAAQQRKAALSEEQRKELAGLITEFRKVRKEPQKRLEVIERMGEVGPIGLTNLLEVINQELGKQLGDYRQAFSKAAAGVIAKRADTANLEEITRLRKVVLELAKDDALTKEQIVSVSDPALARLKEIILVTPQDVLASQPPLAIRREALQTLGSQWETCATLLLVKQQDEEERAAREKAGDKEPSEAGVKPEAEVKSEDASAPKAAAGDEQPMELKGPSFADYLAKDEELAVGMAMPMNPRTRSVLTANAQLVGRIDAEEARCVLDLNLTRNLLGLPALKIDLALTAAARDHSSDMATLGFFAHESPVPGKKTPSDRAQRFRTTASGENIAMGTLDGAVANEMWWHSPGHHKNMLGNHERVGLGKSGRHWTELFGS
jgi:uncharacterized protein YkwD